MNNHDQNELKARLLAVTSRSYDQFKTVGETNTVEETKSDISLFSSTITIALDRYKSNSHIFLVHYSNLAVKIETAVMDAGGLVHIPNTDTGMTGQVPIK